MRWFVFLLIGICFFWPIAICAQGNQQNVPQKPKTDSERLNDSAADLMGMTLPLGSFKERYERAGRPHFLGMIVPMYGEVWAEDEGKEMNLSQEQIEIIRAAFASVYKEAGAKITFLNEAEPWIQERQWPSRFFLQPVYHLNNFWRAKGDMVVEITAAYRSEVPSRWEMVALLYDVRTFGGLLFSAHSNELYGFLNRTPPKQALGAKNLRTVSRRVANYLLQRARLPAFDYSY
jgi:hypothetical protein